jgi:ABC-type Fe3+/spermidine/putrescine transport system ATPase subunit
MKILEVRNATKRYGSVTAIHNISFGIERGCATALLGPSGCGKTTTLRAIAGLLTLDDGNILIEGEDVTHARPYERNLGLVFQNYALFPHMTVAQNVGYGLRKQCVRREIAERRVQEALELVRLGKFGPRWPSQLSGGEQQRVALARTIVVRPRLLLLDEPLSNLDEKLRRDMRMELREIFNSVDTTPIIVTHDQREALSLGEKIIVMSRGSIIQSGSPSEIYHNPANRFVGDFIGEMNWLHGILEQRLNEKHFLFRTTCGLKFFVEARDDIKVGEKVVVGIRPERVRLVNPPVPVPASNADRVVISGTLESVDIVADEVEAKVRISADALLLATAKHVVSFVSSIGSQTGVELHASDFVVIRDW